mmetsp:Transcript_31719/g.41931  ORF Transcript_31719/g.41931 Transcript_31719/m.41931 type:complete len:208 (-) Transcript_31719:2647-3270(-)
MAVVDTKKGCSLLSTFRFHRSIVPAHSVFLVLFPLELVVTHNHDSIFHCVPVSLSISHSKPNSNCKILLVAPGFDLVILHGKHCITVIKGKHFWIKGNVIWVVFKLIHHIQKSFIIQFHNISIAVAVDVTFLSIYPRYLEAKISRHAGDIIRIAAATHTPIRDLAGAFAELFIIGLLGRLGGLARAHLPLAAELEVSPCRGRTWGDR